eukprot:snap_masked-scaffold_22-processed-gene-1.15-mRNA-1 protein AED:1.00 eAED:1.00 QI:0/0/0/0/1/1/3/0/244
MKFQKLLGLAQAAVQDFKTRDLRIENIAAGFIDMVKVSSELTLMHQDCSFPNNDIEVCLAPVNIVLEDILGDLSNEDLEEVGEIINNYELSLEEKAEQITSIIGNPGLCTPEFIEVLPRFAFCFYECEDGFCEANEAKLGKEVTKIAAGFGCELVLDDVCKVFDEVQEPIDAGDGSEDEESGDTAEIFRDMRAVHFCMKEENTYDNSQREKTGRGYFQSHTKKFFVFKTAKRKHKLIPRPYLPC